MGAAYKEKAADSVVGVSEQFPVGLKVLVVDDDVLCLRILEQMLRKCMYSVTSCSQATDALRLLREKKGFFDIVLSDVHMPDMDGFKLLEFVGLEMDLPVIMMSGDDRTSIIMKGISHGACDYLIKPIRTEELQNIWQHVIRKRCNVNKEHEPSGSLEDNDQWKFLNDDGEYASSVNEEPDAVRKIHKRRKDAKDEEDGDTELDDHTTSKKPRVVWSVELHQQFVSAVNQLGIDKAVPKRILELMNVPGLSRENVASHLQKFRLYLKRLSEVSHQQNRLPNPFGGPLDQNPKSGLLGEFDVQPLVASGQISPEVLAALHAEIFSRPASKLVLPSVDQPAQLQVSLAASKYVALGQNVAYGQPLVKCPSNISKHFSPRVSVTVNAGDNVHSIYGSWSSKDLVNMVACSNVCEQIGNKLTSLIQHQQQQPEQQQKQQERDHSQYMLPEHARLISEQPSCLVVPSHSPASIAGGDNIVSANQYCNFSRNAVAEYSNLSPRSNNSLFRAGKTVESEVKPTSASGGLPCTGSTPTTMPSCLVIADNGVSLAAQNSIGTSARPFSALVPNNSVVFGSYDATLSKLVDQGLPMNTAFSGRGTMIPNRFAVDEPEPPSPSILNYGRVYQQRIGNKVKQEPSVNFVGNGKVGITSVQHLASDDIFSAI